METRTIKPGEVIKIIREKEFYNEATMITIRAIGVSETQKNAEYKFTVTYSNSKSPKIISFWLLLSPPIFMSGGRANPEMANYFAGPFDTIKIESFCNTPVIIQYSFTDKLK